jgi:nucleoside-diphosphate-sugar epimerase/uncharacterized membrane protein
MTSKEIIVITGSSGFIGSALIKKLAGHFVLAGFDRMASRSPPPAAECICIDLTSEDGVKDAFERVRFAYGNRIASVIHLAAYYDLSGEPSPLYDEITVQGTERLLRHLQDFEVGQFIFSSTMLVHAPVSPGQRIDEDSPIEPRWAYPQSKVKTEALVRERRVNIPVVVLRIAGVYDDRGHNPFLAQQLSRVYENTVLSHVFPGDVSHGQAFAHLEDFIDVVLNLIEKRKELPSELTLLVGEPETLSYKEIQDTAGRLMHGEAHWEIREIPKAVAKTGAWIEDEILGEDPFIKPWMIDFADDHYALDVSRARRLLNWTPQHSLREALPRIIGNLKADPVGWYRSNKLDSSLVAARALTQTEAKVEKPRKKPETRQSPDNHTSGENAQHGNATYICPMHPDYHADVPGKCPICNMDFVKPGKVPQKSGVTKTATVGDKEKTMDMGGGRQTRWAHFANIGLGAWLITSPVVFGMFGGGAFSEAVLRVTAERSLPMPEWRTAMLASSCLSLMPRFSWAQWANTFVGLWLLVAPLVFWAPSAAVYANDTLIGALAITFAVLVPMMPGMSMEGMMDPSVIPPGWSYSPSSWAQRMPIILMGLVGFLIARWLAAYQLGHVSFVWDPFFNGKGALNGTETIITSNVSKAWPIPDGGLGAVAYMLEILMAAMGGANRWRTMPWMVTFFGILVVPLGVISIYFIIIQPIVIGTWCSLCLVAALAMVIMIPFALDELVAMGQFLAWSHRSGKPFWRTFLMGDAMPGGRTDDMDDLRSLPAAISDTMRGMTVPWTLVASAAIGLMLMFTRVLFGTVPPMANSDHLIGALIFTVAAIATAEVARPIRFINALFGAWLIVAPWLLAGSSTIASWTGAAAGLALIALSLPRGKRSEQHYAGWDRYVV